MKTDSINDNEMESTTYSTSQYSHIGLICQTSTGDKYNLILIYPSLVHKNLSITVV